jgi:hypothetical protein
VPALLVSSGFAHRRRELRDRGEKGPGGEAAAVLFDDQGELDEAEAEPAERLGHRDRRPSELGGAAPRLLGNRPLLYQLAHYADRALALEHRAHRGPQLLLLVTDVEVHARSHRN